MMAPPMKRAPSGVVLLSILLILALLSALAYQMVGRHSLVVAQARHSFTYDQALAYALGAEAFARQILHEDWEQTGAGVDNLQEAWAQPLQPFEIDEGLMELQIRDLNGCFNLNSLASSDPRENVTRLKTLLRNLSMPESLADAWRDWVDADSEVNAFGAEDGEYLLSERPYRAANRMAADLSELKLLKDMEPEYYDALRDVVCLIPSDELRINVNTADAHSLAAFSTQLSTVQMEALADAERTYTDVAEVVNEYPDLASAGDSLTVASQYFEVQVRAQVGESRAELATVLHRDPEDGKLTLIRRDLGRNFRSLFEADAPEET